MVPFGVYLNIHYFSLNVKPNFSLWGLVSGAVYEPFESLDSFLIFWPNKLEPTGRLVVKHHCTDILLNAGTIHASLSLWENFKTSLTNLLLTTSTRAGH